MDSKITRRTFGKAAAGLAAVASLKASVSARAAGASEKINIALIGCGGMGRVKLGNLMDSKRVNVVMLCDIDPKNSGLALKAVKEKLNQTPKVTKNFHEVMDDKSIDAAVVSTPDHWHAIPMILACQAGKDVYCEKPCCHNILEGLVMVKAAHKYNRIVQIGTHQRSIDHIRAAREFIQAGKLGLISMTNTFTSANFYPSVLGNEGDSKPPAGVDYDTWLGPAPVRPFNRRRFHKKWRWYFDYGCGMVGDWNVHLQDFIMWAMGYKAPVSVCTTGGHLLLEDDRDTPDTMQAVYEFASSALAPGGCVQTYTMRQASGKNCSVGGYGMVVHGTTGMLELTRKNCKLTSDHVDWDKPDSPFRYKDETGKESPGFARDYKTADDDGHLAHAINFLDCVVSRKPPHAVIDEHIGTVIACHLANVSLKLGRGFADDKGFIKLSHEERKKHLDKIVGGHKIYWDAEKSLCYKDAKHTIEDKEANALLGREYRKGFELPVV